MVQYNANVHQRAPFTGVPVVEGDHGQRVTVNMPANPQVLHDLCINRLRMADPITMYINGEIMSDSTISRAVKALAPTHGMRTVTEAV